jgi:hypothetical protein
MGLSVPAQWAEISGNSKTQQMKNAVLIYHYGIQIRIYAPLCDTTKLKGWLNNI